MIMSVKRPAWACVYRDGLVSNERRAGKYHFAFGFEGDQVVVSFYYDSWVVPCQGPEDFEQRHPDILQMMLDADFYEAGQALMRIATSSQVYSLWVADYGPQTCLPDRVAAQRLADQLVGQPYFLDPAFRYAQVWVQPDLHGPAGEVRAYILKEKDLLHG